MSREARGTGYDFHKRAHFWGRGECKLFVSKARVPESEFNFLTSFNCLIF